MNWKVKVGHKYSIINGFGGYLKVMAIIDGYVMARYKGCIPFCESENAFINRVLNNCKID